MHRSVEMWNANPESRSAAFLLLNFKMLAKEEMDADASVQKNAIATIKRFVPPMIASDSVSCLGSPQQSFSDDEDPEDEYSDAGSIGSSSAPKMVAAQMNRTGVLSSGRRVRTVSVCSQGDLAPSPRRALDASPQVAKACTSFEGNRISPSSPSKKGTSSTAPPTSLAPDLFVKPPSSKLVGLTCEGPVKDVLKRKFSWKNYPALEAYLVDHRGQYLEYSSNLNYTSEQKQYNNRLTQGLLDLAASEGFVFEDFTFAAIRDRIRCYYKSFVQAIKKKKRKKRGV